MKRPLYLFPTEEDPAMMFSPSARQVFNDACYLVEPCPFDRLLILCYSQELANRYALYVGKVYERLVSLAKIESEESSHFAALKVCGEQDGAVCLLGSLEKLPFFECVSRGLPPWIPVPRFSVLEFEELVEAEELHVEQWTSSWRTPPGRKKARRKEPEE